MKRVRRAELADAIRAAARGRDRVLVAIAGAPGSGKSTLATRMARTLGAGTGVLPMDGFHLDNATLEARDMLARKGAPETFDIAGFTALLHRVKQGGAIRVPTFDRTADAVVTDGAEISAETKIVLVEGNYLLLDAPGWRELSDMWDVTVALSVPLNELEERLVRRWLNHGLTPKDAQARAEENDLRNARLVVETSRPAEYVIGPLDLTL